MKGSDPLHQILRKCIHTQIFLSQQFDRLLPEKYRIDGHNDFRTAFVRPYLQNNLTVYDIGGGKNPLFGFEEKRHFELTVVGLDIEQQELEQAPEGIYDRTICADITTYRGESDADLVICNAVLEHVQNIDAAFAGIASILKPGGIALVFVPSKNALYARLNLLLPESFKKQALYSILPQTQHQQGFKSYYDRCTPRDFAHLAQNHGFEIIAKRVYFLSAYFAFCFPLYVLWRIWLLLFHRLAGEQAAETFSCALQKKPE